MAKQRGHIRAHLTLVLSALMVGSSFAQTDGAERDAQFVFRTPEETAAAHAKPLPAPVLPEDPFNLDPNDMIPPEVEYQFLKLTSIIAAGVDADHLTALSAYTSTGPQPDGVDLDILAAAVDVSVDQVALQSTPEDVVAGGLYLLATGHLSRANIEAKLALLLHENPRLKAFDLNLMEEAVLVRWSVLDALESIRARPQESDIDTVIERFNSDTLNLNDALSFAVFENEIDTLTATNLNDLDYTLRAYALGVNRDIDDRAATVAIRRAGDLNRASKEQADRALALRLRQLLGRRNTF